MFLDYGAASSLSQKLLDADDPEINFLYSGARAAPLPTVLARLRPNHLAHLIQHTLGECATACGS